MMHMALVLLCAAVGLSGCASASKNIAVSYVSPAHYQNHTCEQLELEYQRIRGREEQLRSQLDDKAAKDRVTGAFGAIIFFPALLWVGGTEEQEVEYGILKGDYDAITLAAWPKKCRNIPAPSVTEEEVHPATISTP